MNLCVTHEQLKIICHFLFMERRNPSRHLWKGISYIAILFSNLELMVYVSIRAFPVYLLTFGKFVQSYSFTNLELMIYQ